MRLTPFQLAFVRRKATAKRTEETDATELNIVPFLDVVMNTVMFILASLATAFTATIAIPSPQRCTTDCSDTPSSEFTVKIVREGYIVGTPRGFLQPGCDALGPATITVPVFAGAHDPASLTRCLVRATAAASPSPQRDIQVAVTGEIPYRTLVQTLDAVRETRPGAADLFTAPRLGILN